MQHLWNVTPKEAVEIQKKLRTEISIEPLPENTKIKYIAGADISLNRFSEIIFAGILVLSYPDLRQVEYGLVESTTKFPYIPGLLSFREIPALIEVWEKLKIKPDILVVDGQGIAHPRRMGIASHLGVLLDIPTIGCAKSLLTGVYEEPSLQAGGVSYLRDRYDHKEIIGAVLRTKDKVKPVFISPGNKITLEESLDIMKRVAGKYRIPEPTRLAHELVNSFRRGELKESS